MLNNTRSKGGTEVATKKDFIEIVKRWCSDSIHATGIHNVI